MGYPGIIVPMCLPDLFVLNGPSFLLSLLVSETMRSKAESEDKAPWIGV